MSSSYTDPAAIVQVIGCLFNNASILDETDKYIIKEDDFVETFHRIVAGAIYNIHLTGSQVNLDAIIDYLANRPKYEAVFKQNKGLEYLAEASKIAQPETFNYYYNRLKKMSLLRAYDDAGINVKNLYDPDNILDTKKKQQQEEWLDNTSLEGITQAIDKRVDDIKLEYLDDNAGLGWQAGDGIDELLEELKQGPQIGIPLYGALINTVTKGARLRKYYLRSAPTGLGKSRTMVADACNFACNELYHNQFGWIKNGASQPTLYIGTEQDKREIQTMMLAFISNVDEEHITDNSKYTEGEAERVMRAAQIMKEIPLWCEWLPDFSLQDIENRIKKNIREHDVKYIMFDYIKTSPKILSELTKRSAGVKLREDNVLFMLSSRLKDLANEYGVFIMSSTQLNADWKQDDIPDQNLLRGAKSIADLADIGLILLRATPEDLAKLEPVLSSNPNLVPPTHKISVYKNRGGRYTGCYLWCTANLGTCRIDPEFCTDWHCVLLPLEDTRIILDDGPSAWDK